MEDSDDARGAASRSAVHGREGYPSLDDVEMANTESERRKLQSLRGTAQDVERLERSARRSSSMHGMGSRSGISLKGTPPFARYDPSHSGRVASMGIPTVQQQGFAAPSTGNRGTVMGSTEMEQPTGQGDTSGAGAGVGELLGGGANGGGAGFDATRSPPNPGVPQQAPKGIGGTDEGIGKTTNFHRLRA